MPSNPPAANFPKPGNKHPKDMTLEEFVAAFKAAGAAEKPMTQQQLIDSSNKPTEPLKARSGIAFFTPPAPRD